MFDCEKIMDDVYSINDENMCTVYVVIGSKKALIIDTSMQSDISLLKQIRQLTNLELEVVLTHGHYDHTGHLNEFEHFSIAKDDFYLLPQQYQQKAKILNHLDKIDLGDNQIEVFQLPGHTKGSLIFIDKKHQILFTGDSFGSGCGAWLQVNEALPLSIYKKSILAFKSYLIKNYPFPFSNWNFYGGHLGQEKTGRLGYNPLNAAMIDNFIILIEKLLQKEVQLQDTTATQFHNEKSYYVSYQSAEMIVRPSIIC